MNIKTLQLNSLNPAAYNPRKDLKPGDAEYEKLKRSIGEYGLVEPIVWNQRTGNVVGGHQRLKVLRDMGVIETECVVVDLDENREKALNVALNKIDGEWDYDALKSMFEELDAQEFDKTLTGFDMDEIDRLFAAPETKNTGKEISFTAFEDDKFECTCPKCGFKFNKG